MTPVSEAYLMDCMEYMRNIPDKYFDLAISDPQYGIGADNPSIKPCKVQQKNGTVLSVKQNIYPKKNWDKKIPDKKFFKELFRVSKNQIIWGANYFGLKGGMIVWDKLNGDSDQFGCEIAYQSFNNRTDIVYFMWRGMIQGSYCGKNIRNALIQIGNKKMNEVRIHPTQKPVALYAYLLRQFAKPGDKILDTHLGSGSSRIAAFKMGFDFYATEIDKDYFLTQEERFRKECLRETTAKDGRVYVQPGLFL